METRHLVTYFVGTPLMICDGLGRAPCRDSGRRDYRSAFAMPFVVRIRAPSASDIGVPLEIGAEALLADALRTQKHDGGVRSV